MSDKDKTNIRVILLALLIGFLLRDYVFSAWFIIGAIFGGAFRL